MSFVLFAVCVICVICGILEILELQHPVKEVGSALHKKSDHRSREAISLTPWLQPGDQAPVIMNGRYRFNGFRYAVNR